MSANIHTHTHSVQLYGGDIVLSELQRAILESDDPPTNTLRPKRAVVSSGTDLWPNGIVPYEMDSSLSEFKTVDVWWTACCDVFVYANGVLGCL